MATRNFKSILTNIEAGSTNKNILKRDDVKQLFSDYVKKGGGIALDIERKVVPQKDDQIFLHSSGGTVLRLFKMDADILGDLLTYSGYTKEQISDINKACTITLESLSNYSELVFRGHQTKTPLLHTPGVRARVQATNKQRILSETHQRAFINYLQQEGFPALVLEHMARLSLYQEYNFAEDLEKNEKLKQIYDTFLHDGKLPESKVVEAAKFIEDGILMRMRAHAVFISRDTNGYNIAKPALLNKADIRSLYDKAPSHYLDAYTVQDRVMYAASVTTTADLESNHLNTLNTARAIRHGILKGTLPNIDTYQVRGYCNSEVYNNKEIQVALKHLVKTNVITDNQRQALVNLSLHQEMLKLLSNTAPDEYVQYSPHIRIGLYGDNYAPLIPKNAKDQVMESVEQLRVAAQTLSSVCAINPGLNHMLTPVWNLSLQLSDAYRYASFLAVGHQEQEGLKNTLDEVGLVIDNMHESLSVAGIPDASKVISASLSIPSVQRRLNNMVTTYNDLEYSLSNNVPTAGVGLKDKKEYSLIDGRTNSSRISQILSGTYKHNVTKSAVRDSIIQRIDEVETLLSLGTCRKNSFMTIKKGVQQLIKYPEMLRPALSHIVLEAPRLAAVISQWDSTGDSVEAFIKRGVEDELKKQPLQQTSYACDYPA